MFARSPWIEHDDEGNITVLNGQTIAFPKARKFSDLFDDSEPWRTKRTVEGRVAFGTDWVGAMFHSTPSPGYAQMDIGPYCSVYDKAALAVRANDAVVLYVKENMLFIDRDRMSFQIIRWPNDKALVTLQYSAILGSRWLGFIDWESVPWQQEQA